MALPSNAKQQASIGLIPSLAQKSWSFLKQAAPALGNAFASTVARNAEGPARFILGDKVGNALGSAASNFAGNINPSVKNQFATRNVSAPLTLAQQKMLVPPANTYSSPQQQQVKAVAAKSPSIAPQSNVTQAAAAPVTPAVPVGGYNAYNPPPGVYSAAALSPLQQTMPLPPAPTTMPLPPSPETLPANPASPAPQYAVPPEVLAARQAYLKTFSQSPGEQTAIQQLAALQAQQANADASTNLGIADVRNKAIPLRFVTGQSQNLLEQNAAIQGGLAAQAVPLQTRLAMEQAARQSSADMAKADLGFKEADLAAQVKEADSFSLGEGEKRFRINPKTGQYEEVASGSPKTVKAEAPDIKETSAGYIQWNPGTGKWEPLMLNGKTVGSKTSSADIKTSVVEIGGRKLLIDDLTGETIKDLGTTQDVGKEQQRAANVGSQAEVVMGSVDTAKDLVGKSSTLGSLGRVAASKIPGTDSYNLARIIDTIKANISFDTLQKMRESSPTGGALGAVSDREINLLSATIGSLDIGQSTQQLNQNLDAIRTHYENWKNAVQEAGGGASDPDFQALRNDPDLKNYSDAQIRDILGKTSVGGDTKLLSLKIGNKNVVVRKEIAPRLAAAAREFKATTGRDLIINEDYRSSEHQAELYKKSQAGQIGRAAPPGYSRHEAGLAIDVANWKEAERILRKYGFKNDLADDKNHFSLGEFA